RLKYSGGGDLGLEIVPGPAVRGSLRKGKETKTGASGGVPHATGVPYLPRAAGAVWPGAELLGGRAGERGLAIVWPAGGQVEDFQLVNTVSKTDRQQRVAAASHFHLGFYRRPLGPPGEVRRSASQVARGSGRCVPDLLARLWVEAGEIQASLPVLGVVI